MALRTELDLELNVIKKGNFLENPKENPHFEGFLAEDSKVGGDDAAVMPARLDRYAKAHHRAIRMSDYAMKMAESSTSRYDRIENNKLAAKLHSCGNYLLFRNYYTVNKVRLHAAKFCDKSLLCPLCAIRRGARMVKTYLAKLEFIKKENPNLKAFLVTLTVKDGEDLDERFTHLYRSVQRLHKTRSGKGQHSEACKAEGAVWSYEFKRGKNSDKWHPHVHAIWLCETPPDAKQLSKEWKKITGDSFIVDVTPFHNQDDVVSGFLEVFKYALKFSELTPEDNWESYKILSKKRLIASFGLFYGLDISGNLLDDELDDLPYVDMLYKFIFGAGYSLTEKNDLPEEFKTHRKFAPPNLPPEKYKKGGDHLSKLQKKYPDKKSAKNSLGLPVGWYELPDGRRLYGMTDDELIKSVKRSDSQGVP